MSLFTSPAEHAANPPATWQVIKVADRHWELRTADGGRLNSYGTKHQAEAARTEGFIAEQYERDRRWYANDKPDPRYRPFLAAGQRVDVGWSGGLVDVTGLKDGVVDGEFCGEIVHIPVTQVRAVHKAAPAKSRVAA